MKRNRMKQTRKVMWFIKDHPAYPEGAVMPKWMVRLFRSVGWVPADE